MITTKLDHIAVSTPYLVFSVCLQF